jgi:hypothetical protein
MKRLRSVVAQSPAIVISVLALILSAGGGGAAYAATSASRAPAITWHKLTLLHGWKSSQSQYASGNPEYSVSNGVVYLAGSLHQASGTSQEFAILPKAARPTHDLWITVYTMSGTSGTLYIGANGDMAATSLTPADAQDYTSLAAVSYPASS